MRRNVAVALWLVLMFLVACSREQASSDPFETVEVPDDLDRLDLSVRRQFETVWSDQREHAGTPSPQSNMSARKNWGDLGMWYHTYRYSESAARCYRNAIRLERSNPRWPYYLGILLKETGSHREAREYFDLALSLEPDAIQVHNQLGDLALETADLELAGTHYRAALRSSSDDPSARLGLARIALQTSDSKTALTWLQPLHAEQPQATEVTYALADAWRLDGSLVRASELLASVSPRNVEQIVLARRDPWLRELTELDVGSRVLTRKGVRAAGEGRFGEAAMHFGSAVVRDPDGPDERINYALSLWRLGKKREAIAQIRSAVSLSDEGSEIRAKAELEYARMLLHGRRTEEAEALLLRQATDRPNDPLPRTELSRLYHSRGDLALAVDQYAELRTLGPVSEELAFWHATALLGQAQIETAFRQIEDDIPKIADSTRLTLLRARALAVAPDKSTRQVQAALDALIASRQPRDVLFAETVAMLWARLGRYDHATDWQRSAVSALISSRTTASEQIARRRLALYREKKSLSNPWERFERPVQLEIPDHATNE